MSSSPPARANALDDLFAAMEEVMERPDTSSPNFPPSDTVLGKRRRSDNNEEADLEDELAGDCVTGVSGDTVLQSSAATITTTNNNFVNVAKRWATAKRLRPDQQEELLNFAIVSDYSLFVHSAVNDCFQNNSALTRLIKLFGLLLAMENELKKIVTVKSRYQVPSDLVIIIKSYTLGVLLSPKISVYKGEEPLQKLLVYCFDL